MFFAFSFGTLCTSACKTSQNADLILGNPIRVLALGDSVQMLGVHLAITLISVCISNFCSVQLPDPPILAFFDFLAFFVFRFALLFGALFHPFPRILGVPRREKPLFFRGFPCLFFQKSKGWRVRAPKTQRS